MEREVGGGIGMGNTCKPMAVSFQCMTKFTTNKKKNKNKKKSHAYVQVRWRIIKGRLGVISQILMHHCFLQPIYLEILYFVSG